MNIENIGLRILLDIPASKILTSGEDLERFKKSIGEGDLDNARLILEEAVDEDMLLDAYCYADSDKICMTSIEPTQTDYTGIKSYTY